MTGFLSNMPIFSTISVMELSNSSKSTFVENCGLVSSLIQVGLASFDEISTSKNTFSVSFIPSLVVISVDPGYTSGPPSWSKSFTSLSCKCPMA